MICSLAFFPICLKGDADGPSCLMQEISIWQTPLNNAAGDPREDYLTSDMGKRSLIPQLFWSPEAVHHSGKSRQKELPLASQS